MYGTFARLFEDENEEMKPMMSKDDENDEPSLKKRMIEQMKPQEARIDDSISEEAIVSVRDASLVDLRCRLAHRLG